MIWRVEVWHKEALPDPVARGVLHDLADIGVYGARQVEFRRVYMLQGDISAGELRRIATELLCDPVAQDCCYGPIDDERFSVRKTERRHVIEIAYNPGVMDPWALSVLKAIADSGIGGVWDVCTGSIFVLHGELTAAQCRLIGEKLLYNKVIQHAVISPEARVFRPEPSNSQAESAVLTVALLGKGELELTALSAKHCLSLTGKEMTVIQQHFCALGRNPTDAELETIAQTWSEHCMHKTFRGIIDYTDLSGRRPRRRRITNLLKTTIMAATATVNKPWCVSVFSDNAGIIRFNREHNLCFKVETHNHPSALDPYGGAGTGVGGVIRDILGAGLGAKPIVNTDVFCFGLPDTPVAALPAGALHPKRIMKGVVAGVRDYGNRMGIPTANGAVVFDERYVGNPLVYCGTVGIMPVDAAFGKAAVGDYVVVVGGRTGRDGIHGATFSSLELSHESETVSSGAVQIGNAITEKKILDVLLQARDRKLFSAVTDCGAGGLSSAVGELGQETGVRVDLEKVPLKYKGLSYTEIWISEAQERMVLAVPPQQAPALQELFAGEDVQASVIGEFTATGRLQLDYHGRRVADLDMAFLHGGVPAVVRAAVWQPPKIRSRRGSCPKNASRFLLGVLGDLTICSKEWIIRQYDHEVQGMSVLKPLAGSRDDGPQDATVLQPVAGERRGIVVACGINPRYADIDPYWMAAGVVEEALRNVVAVGANSEQTAILDNFSWGNTAKPDCLGQLVRACEGARDAAVALGLPFISGKDSLNNEYAQKDGGTTAIPGTLLISALGIIDDVEQTVSMDLKTPGNALYVIGRTYDELGASSYERLRGWRSAAVPRLRFAASRKILTSLSGALRQGLVRSCHDCSDGGLSVTLAEMAFAGDCGLTVDLRRVLFGGKRQEARDDVLMFSESHSRFVVEITPEQEAEFCRVMRGVACARIGEVSAGSRFVIKGLSGAPVVALDVQQLRQAWKAPLGW